MNIRTKTKKLNFRAKPIGATAVEYMIMLILIALFIIGIMRVFGDTISNKVARASGGIENMSEQSGSSADGVGGEAGNGGSDGNGSGNGSGKGKSGSGKGKSGSAANGSGDGSGKDGKGSGKGKGKGSKGGIGKNKQKKGKQMVNGRGESVEEEEEDSGPGINPVILLIAMGMLGLLIYVMTAKKKGS